MRQLLADDEAAFRAAEAIRSEEASKAKKAFRSDKALSTEAALRAKRMQEVDDFNYEEALDYVGSFEEGCDLFRFHIKIKEAISTARLSDKLAVRLYFSRFPCG